MRRLVLLAAVSATAVVLLLPAARSPPGASRPVRRSLAGARRRHRHGHRQARVPQTPAPRPCCCSAATPRSRPCPASVVVPTARQTANFPISTNAAAPPTIVQLTAWVGNTPRSANLSVNPAAAGRPVAVGGLGRSRATLTGGSPATGTVTFTGATDGADRAALHEQPRARPGAAGDGGQQGPGERRVPGDDEAGDARTRRSRSPRSGSTSRGPRRSRSRRARRPPPDKVAIQTATWKKGLLTIKATSTNPNAILSVFSSAGQLHVRADEQRRRQVLRPARVRHQPASRSRSAATSAGPPRRS